MGSGSERNRGRNMMLNSWIRWWRTKKNETKNHRFRELFLHCAVAWEGKLSPDWGCFFYLTGFECERTKFYFFSFSELKPHHYRSINKKADLKLERSHPFRVFAMSIEMNRRFLVSLVFNVYCRTKAVKHFRFRWKSEWKARRFFFSFVLFFISTKPEKVFAFLLSLPLHFLWAIKFPDKVYFLSLLRHDAGPTISF